MIVIIIPAKGGSTRLPNKNMALINGRPMLDYAIDYARTCSRADAIYVTTDADAIADHAGECGIEVIRRPESLGGDTLMVDVLSHALGVIGNPEIDTVINVQVDHPDRDLALDDVLDRYLTEGADLLNSTEADGTKNGAHHIVSRRYLETGESTKTVTVVDDCTNVHYQEDLDRAAARLRAR